MSRRKLIAPIHIFLLLVSFGGWQLLVHFGVLSPFAVAAPSTIAQQVWNWVTSGEIWNAIGVTLATAAVGYVVGVGGGVVIGMLMGRGAFLKHYFDVFITFLNSLPRLVLIPFLIGIFGFGMLPGMIVSASLVIFVVILNTQAAVVDVRGDVVVNARILGANSLQLLTTVYIPGVALSILSSARVCVGLALQAAVVTQFFGSTEGLGYLISYGQQVFNAGQIYAAILVTSILATVIDLLLGRVERRASRWLPGRVG